MAPSGPSEMIDCTEPLPNERVPMSGRALVVLQGAGDDFGGRGRAAVDQDDQRDVGDLGVEVIGMGVVAGAFLLERGRGSGRPRPA